MANFDKSARKDAYFHGDEQYQKLQLCWINFFSSTYHSHKEFDEVNTFSIQKAY